MDGNVADGEVPVGWGFSSFSLHPTAIRKDVSMLECIDETTPLTEHLQTAMSAIAAAHTLIRQNGALQQERYHLVNAAAEIGWVQAGLKGKRDAAHRMLEVADDTGTGPTLVRAE